jgi:Starch-binding associating with outer membrane
MNKIILTLLVSLVLLGSSCSKFLSVNEVNPNSASAVPPQLLLPAALTNIVKIMDNPRNFEFVYLWHGLWSISSGYSQPSSLMQYRLLNSSYSGAFSVLYTVGQNLTEIEKAAKDPKDAGFLAIGMIMKAYIMQNLVDCWGNVPYTEAFSATDGILKPKYDDQKAIYEDLVVKLDAAIALIQGLPADATEIKGSSDVMFGGNVTLWAKFANTLKLRILVHQSDMASRDSYIKAAISKTASVGYLGAGEGALVNPGFLVSDSKMNPFYETFYTASGTGQSDASGYYYAGKDAVEFLAANNDPRLGRFFLPYSGSSYAGNYLGQNPDTHTALAASLTSKLGYKPDEAGYMIGTPTESAPILTDFESLFIQAEAAYRGFTSGDPKALYDAAITQSFIHMGLSEGDASTFLGQQKYTVNYDLAPNKLVLILTQKWASLNGIAPVEIWTDFRRSGIPDFIHFTEDANKANERPPVRLLYPQREISVNNDNVVAVGKIDAFSSKIFWQTR